MTRVAVGALALLLVLAGCGGGDPKADPSPTQSSSPSPSVSPTAPAMPDAAQTNTKAGAIAFAEYYVELINHAQATGDVEPLRAVEGPGCDSCSKVRASIRQIYGNGGSIEGGGWRPHFTVALENENGTWLVSGFIRFEAERVQNSSDAPVVSNPGGSAQTHMTVRNVGTTWEVLTWSRES